MRSMWFWLATACTALAGCDDALVSGVQRYGNISGFVCAAEAGEIVVGADIFLDIRRGDEVVDTLETTTDEAGEFEFENIPVGDHVVRVRSDSVSTSAPVRVENEQTTNIDILSGDSSNTECTRPPGSIRGRVCNDATYEWLDDARVFVNDAEDASQVYETRSDALGNFLIEEVPQGTYTLVVRKGEYVKTIEGIEVRSREETLLQETCDAPPGRLVGRVCDTVVGAWVDGAAVTITDAVGAIVANLTTDADGKYNAGELAPGDYQVIIDLESGPMVFNVSVDPDGYVDLSPPSCDARLGSVIGRVCAPESGEFLDAADVWLDLGEACGEDATNLADCHSALSDADGRFRIDDVPVGTYTLFVRKAFYRNTVPGVVVEADVDYNVEFGACDPAWTFQFLYEGLCAVADTGAGGSVTSLDLLFLVDTTGSMGAAIRNLQNSLASMLASIRSIVPDSRFAVAHFEDYPLSSWGSTGDMAYELFQPLTTDTSLVEAALDALTTSGGGPIGAGADAPEAGMEALYQAATGAGFDANRDGDFNDVAEGDVPQYSVGWRGAETEKIIVHVTDAAFRDPDDADPAPEGANGESDAVAALLAAGIKVVGIVARGESLPNEPYDELVALARSTGGISEHGYDANADGDLVDTGDIPANGPLVFKTLVNGTPIGAGGANMGEAIAAAVETLVTYTVTVEIGGEDASGLTIDRYPPYYTDVEAGDEVCFSIIVTGTVPAGEDAEPLDVTFSVITGDGIVLETADFEYTPEAEGDFD